MFKHFNLFFIKGIQIRLSCTNNISEGAAPRQWRSPRRGARRVGEITFL